MAERPACCHHPSLGRHSVSVATACFETPAGGLGTTRLGSHSSDSDLLLWACPSLRVHHWGSQGPGEGSWEGQYQSHLSAPRACGDFSTLQIKLESALGSVTYHSKGGTAMLSVFPGYADTLKCGFFGAKVSA